MEKSKFKQLKELLNNSYAPYSKFKTAVIVSTDKGEFAGVNVENARFSSTICAERNAIFSAIARGAKKFKTIDIISSSTKQDIVPCGVCLQVMSEFFAPNTKINFYNINGKKKVYLLKDLLPFMFNKKQLNKRS